MQDVKVCEVIMKTFKISSPAYQANGLNGTYFSIAFCDENGNVIKGFGDHISEDSFGIKNVFDAVGTPFSDDDRLISIEEINVSEESFNNWMDSYEANQKKCENRSAEERELFTDDPYHFVYSKKEGQTERLNKREEWKKNNPIPQFKFYSFLDLIAD